MQWTLSVGYFFFFFASSSMLKVGSLPAIRFRAWGFRVQGLGFRVQGVRVLGCCASFSVAHAVVLLYSFILRSLSQRTVHALWK